MKSIWLLLGRGRRISLGAAFVVILALIAGACSAISSEDSELEQGASDAAAASPLTEFINILWGYNLSEEERIRRTQEDSLIFEELISKCMNEAGFQYLPARPNVEFAPPPFWPTTDRNLVAQYGYGVVDIPGGRQPEGELYDYDPNAEYLANLSTAELTAFNETLEGVFAPNRITEWEPTADGQIPAEVRAQMGCRGWAGSQLPVTTNDVLGSVEFAPLLASMNRMSAAINQKPEFVAAERNWANCMAEAGYAGLTQPADAPARFWDESAQILQTVDWDWDAEPFPTGADLPELADLQRREIAMALTDLDCREATELDARLLAITNTAEKQWMENNQPQLDALLAAVEQLRN